MTVAVMSATSDFEFTGNVVWWFCYVTFLSAASTQMLANRLCIMPPI